MLQWKIEKNEGPLVAAAIHNGHHVTAAVQSLMSLGSDDRLREEDPYTGIWTSAGNTKIVLETSRFQTDVNRPPEKAVYLTAEDSFGLTVWRTPPGDELLKSLYQSYHDFYSTLKNVFDSLLAVHKKLFVFDLHTYNHHRQGADKPFDDPEKNPEVNIGTGNLDRGQWRGLVERFIRDISSFDYNGRKLDVRENVKFTGGYFSRWLNMTYGNSVCCIAIEFKKFFMDEWTGSPDMRQVQLINELLHSAVPGIKQQLAKASAA